MKTTTVPTYTATIYVGTRIGRSKDPDAIVPRFPLETIQAICQRYCDEVGLCVTVTPTRFIYTNGGEDGAAVGLINYPRFPKTREELRGRALELARRLKDGMHQMAVSVVFLDETVMLSDEEDGETK